MQNLTYKQKKKLSGKGLPVVSSNTIDAMFQVYAGKKWGKHLSEVRDRLLQENPHLVKFIENQVGKFPVELHNPLFEIFIGAISALEHQIMVDKVSIRASATGPL
jgi:hypothetical protein